MEGLEKLYGVMDEAYFPLLCDLSEKKIVVIGAGKIASRRSGFRKSHGTLSWLHPVLMTCVLTLAKRRTDKNMSEEVRERIYTGPIIVIAGTMTRC